MKAVDLVAIAPREKSCCWLIEVKDYRRQTRSKPSDLADEVAAKVRDTLAGLVSAQHRANDHQEKTTAQRALGAADVRVVLHLEQPTTHSKLFPRAINPANVQADLRRKLRGVDRHPLVVEISTSSRTPRDVGTVAGA